MLLPAATNLRNGTGVECSRFENLGKPKILEHFQEAYFIVADLPEIWVVLRKGVPRGVTVFESVLLICCQ